MESTQPSSRNLDRDPGPATRPFGLVRDAWGRLVLIDADGRRHVGVEPVRAFPISDPRGWISLCDIHGRELLSIEPLPPDLISARRRRH